MLAGALTLFAHDTLLEATGCPHITTVLCWWPASTTYDTHQKPRNEVITPGPLAMLA